METRDIITFAKIVGKLKTLKRAGWVKRGIKNPESVAEHSFRVVVLAMILSHGKKLNVEKVLKMAVIHDLAEALVGDIIWEWGNKQLIPEESKLSKEREALRKIFKDVPNKEEYFDLWREWEKQETPESQFIKKIDKLETSIQTLEYENQGADLEAFWIYAKKYLVGKEFVALLDEILKEREKLQKKK